MQKASQPPTPNQTELEVQQHFIELGRLSATLLHEISSPLSTAILQLESAPIKDSDQIKSARQNLKHIQNYVESARSQIRNNSSRSKTFCIRPHLLQVLFLTQPYARSKSVDLAFENMPHFKLNGDFVKFQQTLVNLIMNSIDAYSDQPSPVPRKIVRLVIDEDPGSITIHVIDFGMGIPRKEVQNIFEPFYSTKYKRSSSGLGIGLTIVKQHVENDFHGRINVRSSARLGTIFSVRLPGTEYDQTHKKH
ncbi:MAG: sensor histidine kinase [Candidatus Saccharimonadales bacterium]